MSDDINTIVAARKFSTSPLGGRSTRHVIPHLTCADGFEFSVQASEIHYCTPRVSGGPWHTFEVGYPSECEVDLLPYAEDEENPTDTVYGWVPADVIDGIIAKHGGLAA